MGRTPEGAQVVQIPLRLSNVYLMNAKVPVSPGEHYFHADRLGNRQNIQRLVSRGVETFYLGHGGPVSRADVIQAFDLHP